MLFQYVNAELIDVSANFNHNIFHSFDYSNITIFSPQKCIYILWLFLIPKHEHRSSRSRYLCLFIVKSLGEHGRWERVFRRSGAGR